MANWESLKPLKRHINVLTMVVLGLSACLIFTPRGYFHTMSAQMIDKNSNDKQFDWISKDNAIIYIKPDNKSTPVYLPTKGTGFFEIGRTKYFIKISFTNESGAKQEGYVLKEYLQKHSSKE